MKLPSLVALAVVSWSGLVAAEGPVQNAASRTASGPGGLEAAFRAAARAQSEPAWIGWEAPAVGRPRMCCFEEGDCCQGCRFEGHGGPGVESARREAVALEGDGRLKVLVRVEASRVDRVRAVSGNCPVDAGGRTLHWLADVRPAESVALLAGFLEASADRSRDLEHGTLAALALHAAPEADAALERLVAPGQPRERRKQAAFWLGNSRARRGFEILARVVPGDADDDFRAHAAFAFSQSPEPEAVDAMIGLARRDPSGHVRGQALFWLAQKAGTRATAAMLDAVRDDPDTGVKEKAVFALSQLPKDEGVPLLIRTARTSRNPEVRKKAMFWLGQSNDPRALAFFEEVLAR